MTHPSPRKVPGLSSLPTSEIVLPPDMHAELKAIAPKKKRPWLLYFILFVLVGAGAAVAAVKPLREAVLAKIAPKHDQPTAEPSADPAGSGPLPPAPVSASAVPPAIASSAPVAAVSAAPSASASAAPSASASAKPAPKPTVRHPPPRRH